jgi:predicted transcriptional regulator
MERSHHLGDLQAAIMRVLWDAGEATVATVTEELERAGTSRAPTTIATMLTKLERKGVVTHRSEGRQFVYRPTVSESEVASSMVADLTQRLFRGDVTALVSHLLSEQEIDPQELERLRKLIARRAREERNDAR